MEKAPSVEAIQNWLVENNPLGLFTGEFALQDIDPKPWSGHFNFLVTVSKTRFLTSQLVLRFKGPEWGEPTTGMIDEYEILKAVEDYSVGPKAFYLTKDFFGEPMLFEEYLEGEPVGAFGDDKLLNKAPDIARFIAKVNSIALPQELAVEQEQFLSYAPHKKTWRKRLKMILENEHTRVWGERITPLIGKAEKMLDGFEHTLQGVLEERGPVFVFKSAHAGHCIKTKDGFRFFNWERNGWGDPGYTLAVFLASVREHSQFETIKGRMIQAYLGERNVPEFQKLVDHRLREREVSNLLWVLWAYVNRGDTKQIDKSVGIKKRYDRVAKMLEKSNS